MKRNEYEGILGFLKTAIHPRFNSITKLLETRKVPAIICPKST